MSFAYNPSHLSRKLPSSPLTSPVNPFFRKEGDLDPWNDYIPEELLSNNENQDPATTNISSLSSKAEKPYFPSNNKALKEKNLQDPIRTKEPLETFVKKDKKPLAKKESAFTRKEAPENPFINIEAPFIKEEGPFKAPLQTPVSFQRAYKELAQKLLDQQLSENSLPETNIPIIEGLLLGPNQIKALEQQGDQQERSKIGNFSKKLESQAIKTQQKMNNLQQQVYEYELRECTFTPTLNSLQKEGNRDFQEFLDGQKAFQQRSEAKKTLLKENQERRIQEKGSFHPEINRNSKKMIRNQGEVPVYERLYRGNMEKKNLLLSENVKSIGILPEVPEIDEKDLQIQPFTPCIGERSRNMVRNEPIEDILYRDAQRRKEGVNKVQKTVIIKGKQRNLISERLIIQRFIKEFEQATNSIGKDLSSSFDYLQTGEILRSLGFVKEKSEGFLPEERVLISEMWALLKGEEHKGISKRNLCMFLLAVQGLSWNEKGQNNNEKPIISNENASEKAFYNEKSLSNNEKAFYNNESNNEQALYNDYSNQPPSKTPELGYFNENGDWEVDEIGVRIIHIAFEAFYRRKLASETLGKVKEQEGVSNFHPEISETSKVLAEHYRERLLEEFATLLNTQQVPDIKVPENGALTHTDLLVLQRKTQLIQHQKKLKEQEVVLIKTTCPFRPQINRKKGGSTTSSSSSRHLELYQLGKQRIERTDRDPNEIEYERALEQCTFKPEINGNKPQQNNKDSKEFFARNIEKTVERLRNARKDREAVRVWTERGIPLKNNEQNSQMKSSNMTSSRITRNEDEGIREDLGESPKNEGPCEEIENSIENRIPLLYVDVNLGANRTERIVVFEGDESEELAERFVQEHGLDSGMKFKLKDLLDAQIAGVLTRIEEERASLNSDSEFNHQMR